MTFAQACSPSPPLLQPANGFPNISVLESPNFLKKDRALQPTIAAHRTGFFAPSPFSRGILSKRAHGGAHPNTPSLSGPWGRGSALSWASLLSSSSTPVLSYFLSRSGKWEFGKVKMFPMQNNSEQKKELFNLKLEVT